MFDYLKKPRNYNLADFILGKIGRKEKKKQELEKCKERVILSKKYLEIAMESMGIPHTKIDRTKFNVYNNLEDTD